MTAGLCLALRAGSPAAADGPLTSRELYVQAIRTMGDLPQPAFAAYRLEGASEGLNVGLTVRNGLVWLAIQGGSGPQHWALRHRTFDYQSEIVNAADGKRYLTQRSFFDPTWYGAFRALREGMLNAQDPAPPRTLPGDAAATPSPDPSLKTIGGISVMGPAVYDVDDRGAAVCPSGGAGRALHLTSRAKDPMHQLSDVIIDLQSNRFCMMRFGAPSAFGFQGFVEQHYADVGGFWMQTDGLLDGTLRAFGVSLHHGIWRYHLLDMQFPTAVPAEAFAPSALATGPSPSPH